MWKKQYRVTLNGTRVAYRKQIRSQLKGRSGDTKEWQIFNAYPKMPTKSDGLYSRSLDSSPRQLSPSFSMPLLLYSAKTEIVTACLADK